MLYANIHAEGRSNNSLFELEDSVHRFNPSYTPRLLREVLLTQGIELNTPDVNRDRLVSFDIHLEGRPLETKTRPRYLIALENPNINKLNASADYCSQFELVFAWDLRLQHLSNVVPILIPHPMVWREFPGPEQRPIFSCLINANKAFKEMLDNDLYVERIRLIRWYEKNALEHFKLYGLGWNKPPPVYTARDRLARALFRMKTRLLGIAPFPSFQGEVPDKSSVLRQARFSYCYENSRDIPNYITEKMLDSLVSGCVPIYWGANNVQDHVPANCFIDRRLFSDTAAVHQHLMDMDDAAYQRYQHNIRDFLSSELAQKFSSERIVKTIVERICQDFQQRLPQSLSFR